MLVRTIDRELIEFEPSNMYGVFFYKPEDNINLIKKESPLLYYTFDEIFDDKSIMAENLDKGNTIVIRQLEVADLC